MNGKQALMVIDPDECNLSQIKVNLLILGILVFSQKCSHLKFQNTICTDSFSYKITFLGTTLIFDFMNMQIREHFVNSLGLNCT